jgi:hypothetical protein
MVEPLATARISVFGGAGAPPAAPAARRAIAELARSGAPLAARLRTGRELLAAAAPAAPAAWSAAWTAAQPAVARLFPAGLPRGELIELVGARSSGRFGAALELLAAATAAGESAALVDLGDGLDPQEGATRGVDLARLLWARPAETKTALLAAESLLAGGFALVVVELGLAPVPGGRGAEAHWLRLARAARATAALALVSAPYRVAGFAAALALRLSAPRARWLGAGREPRLLDGIDARLTLAHGAAARSAPGALPARERIAS